MQHVPNRANNLSDARSTSVLLDLTTDAAYVANSANNLTDARSTSVLLDLKGHSGTD